MIYFFLFLLTGCGYHFQGSEVLSEHHDPVTLTIPYIRGDKEGELTAALSLKVAQTPYFEYQRLHGTYNLIVKVISDSSDVIGYRYDRNPQTGALRPNILSTENRRTIIALVSMIDTITDTIVVGPFQVTASSDFDFVETSSIYDLTFTPPGSSPQTVINFSLGQLDAIDGANDDVRRPIYQKLADEIVATLLSRWKTR